MAKRIRLFAYRVTPLPEDYEPDPTFLPQRWDDPRIQHLHGVAWHDADLPPWRHKCWPQTKGRVGLDLVERCACGGYGSRGVWLGRNSRRREAMRQKEREWRAPWVEEERNRRRGGVL